MSRVVLIHWDFDTAGTRAERLRRACFEVAIFPGPATASPASLWREPAAAFVVDLDRLPPPGA